MESLTIWNIWNYTLGLFPFVLRKNGMYLSVKSSWPLFLLILATRIAFTYILFKFVCGFYDNVRGTEPQRFSCYLIFASNAFITFHRMWAIAGTKRFLVLITSRLARAPSFFSVAVCVAAANVFIITFKVLCQHQGGYFSFQIMAVIIGGSMLAWGPEIVQSQFSMACYFLRDEFRDIECKLSDDVSLESLKEIKKRLVTSSRLFQRGLKCYKIDLFIATQVGLLFFYVTLNDIILLSFSYVARFPLTPLQIWQFTGNLGYLVGGLAENMMYTVWLTTASTSIGSQVKSVTRALYQKDVSRMNNDVKEEILLTIDQLNDLNFKVDAYGFQTLSSRLIFKSFTTAMTFIFLFIQLFQLRSK